jgi:exopolyphosphatase/guanosine-5'-triphosphate,3'-diphosphate pyrophosphatase
MRLAAIDIGTNSVHMIVVQVKPDLSFDVIDREKEMVRLGAGGLDGRALTPTAVNAALQALLKFKRLADSYQVDEIIAAATSATREAENGGEFLAAIAAKTGIHARVISGEEEARLIHLAACYGIDLGGGSGVVIDIGGGSTEITFGPAAGARLARSFKIGVIRLTERFVRTDPLEPRDERRLVTHIRDEAGGHLRQIARRRVARVIGTSGTILSLGTLASQEGGGPGPGDVRNVRVPVKALHRLRKRLVAMDQQQRLAVPDLDPRRADLAVAGSILIDTLLEGLGASELTLCDLALREGLVIDYVRKNASHIAQVDQYPDIRRRSVLELAERCNYAATHARQVSDLACALFDQTKRVHGLGAREREWLEFAAQLHDVGLHIAHEGHHKHSYYLITNGGLRGFEPTEIEIIALVARAHRRGTPKKSDGAFSKLPRDLRATVRVLSAFLAIAEGLDRSQTQAIARIRVSIRLDLCVIHLTPRVDAELEAWAAGRHLVPLERVLGRPVQMVLEPRRRRGRAVRQRP